MSFSVTTDTSLPAGVFTRMPILGSRLGTSPSATFSLLVRTSSSATGSWSNRLFSYQSLIPATAGTPRYENQARWLVEVFGVIGATPPSPLDSSFRWKDEVGDATYEVSCVSGMARPFSYQ